MCGIIGYTGDDDAIPYLIDGIKNLEYRGYDSFGCAFELKGAIEVRKDAGKIEDVLSRYGISQFSAPKAIFHTRWATHGSVKKENAHPLLDCTGMIAVVHNGIIENWAELKSSLGSHRFVSDTDTEVLAHMVEDEMRAGNSLSDAVKNVFGRIKGSSSFLVMNQRTEELVAVKKGSPLVLGLGKHGTFISSDVPSFIAYTNKVVYLYDGDLVSIWKNKYEIDNLLDKNVTHKVAKVNLTVKDAEKGSHSHFMIKEIMEQPGLIKKLTAGGFGEVEKAAGLVKNARTTYLVGAGTSFHVARLGTRILREFGIVSVPIQGQDITTFGKVIKPDDVFVIISQSGETADLINALPMMKNNKKIGIMNSEESTLAKAVDILIPIGAGPEKAVAATKSFTLSSIYMCLLAAFAAGEKNKALHDLNLLDINLYNQLVPSVYSTIEKAAYRLKRMESVYFLGRDYDFIIALEAALKLKEISYIHAEAIDAATFKHGPLALVSDNTYLVAVVSDKSYDQTIYNLEEIKARSGKIIGISNRNAKAFDVFIRTQDAGMFSFVMQTIILQLLAYRISVLRGLDPDRPKNLAKSVTVK